MKTGGVLLLHERTSTGGSTTGSGGRASGADVGDDVVHRLLGEALGEEAGPVGLDGHLRGLEDSIDLLLLQLRKKKIEMEFVRG